MDSTTNPGLIPEPAIFDDPEKNLLQMGKSEEIWGKIPLIVTDLQFRAIELTVQGVRDSQIAQTLGIDRKTLWNWKTRDDDYRQALEQARAHLAGTTADRCQNVAQQAALVLANFLDEDNEPKYRLRAAQILINSATYMNPRRAKRPETELENPLHHFPPPLLEPKMG